MLQPDNLRLGIAAWGLGMGHWALGILIILLPLSLFPSRQSPVPNPLTTTDIEMVNLCEF
ncbi:hypothetical protein ACEYW6_11110 [Nostoc sp. UIC 10607]|uniref:hypothetical protein n=1 Tax=unclassified Nostoc TaxID=2593658 RepID=UPI0018C4FDB2|nr:hypothetical protein [Nostoc sp. NZL]MBG1244831.1 hypothetical protein [Nostoc sp. NZL]